MPSSSPLSVAAAKAKGFIDSARFERARLSPGNLYAVTPAMSLPDFQQWFRKATFGRIDETTALSLLAAIPRFVAAAPRFEQSDFFQTIDLLLQSADCFADDVPSFPMTAIDGTEKLSRPLVYQLLAGELPWALGHLLPDYKPARAAATAARKRMNEFLMAMFDDSGMPAEACLALHRPLLASWTRCLEWGDLDATDKKLWNADTQQLYEWVVLQAVRFSRPDGTPCFTPFPSGTADGKSFRDLFASALRFDGDRQDRNAAMLAFPEARTKKQRQDIKPEKTPEESHFSEWASCAIFRSGWSPEEPAVAVAFGNHASPAETFAVAEPFGGWTDKTLRLECSNRSRSILSGIWHTAIRIDETPLFMEPGDWEVAGLEMELSYDYLELERPLQNGWKLQRQVLLAHDDELLLLADALLPADLEATEQSPLMPPPGRIEYELAISLYPGITCETDEKATELLVRADGKSAPIARLFPIALPEWRGEILARETGGELGGDARTLVYRQWQTGRGLFAPLLFDLSASRLRRPYTWRQLTVGEQLESVPHDRAAGFRVQLGTDQYLLYRSLTRIANRTVLGHNLVSDLLLARFSRLGVDPVVEIQQEEEA